MTSNLNPEHVTNWNVSYQRQLGADWLATVSYLGSKTTHLWLSRDINAPINLPGATTSNESQRKPLYLLNATQGAFFNKVIVNDDGANANYNAFLVSIRRRFSRNYTVLANYTWSHCISDGDPSGDLNTNYYQDQNNRAADRGSCNFDVRHQINSSFVVVSPVTASGWVGHLLRNWQLAPLVRLELHSGSPSVACSTAYFLLGTLK